MKTENKILLLSVILGVLVTTGHSALDLVLLHKGGAVESSGLPATHEMIINLSILSVFTVFGFLCSFLIARQKTTEQQLIESLHFQEQILESLPLPVFYKDEEFVYKGCNHSFSKLLGLDKREIIGKTVYDISPPDLAETYHEKDVELIGNPGVQRYEFEVSSRLHGTNRQVVFHKATINKPDGRLGGIIGALLDITESKRAAIEKEELIRELKKALANVKLLSGLLPICSSCKKVRDDNGYWKQIEAYIREHSEAEFSHGICPECAMKLYPGYADKQKTNGHA